MGRCNRVSWMGGGGKAMLGSMTVGEFVMWL